MRARPNLAAEEQDSVYAIGKILARPAYTLEDRYSVSMPDTLESFQRALQEAAQDLGLA